MPHSYKTLVADLRASRVEDPEAEARLLLEYFAGVSYATLLSDRDRTYDLPALEDAVARRRAHEPLQYILGAWEFCGRRFTVNEHCLIPRPDTEILVEEAIRRLPAGAKFADLCTGSGCIAVATLCHRPDTQAVALELYEQTLALATENARANGVGERFSPICADLLSDGVDALAAHAPLDAILSNPPYIRTSDLEGLSAEVHKEPRAALDGGEDGLVFYRAILRDYAAMVKPGGQILLEIGYDQADDLRALCAAQLPRADVEVIRDLGGKDRVVAITLPRA